MFKSIPLPTRHIRLIIVAAALLVLTLGVIAIGRFSPVQAAPSAQEPNATSTHAGMTNHGTMGMGMTEHGMMNMGMMDSKMMSTTLSMAEMGAMMDQMMAQMHNAMATMPMAGTMPMSSTMPMAGTMPMSGTMPMADMGMMMQMMGMMQTRLAHMQVMMGGMMSGNMMSHDMMMNGMMHQGMMDQCVMGNAVSDTSGMEMAGDAPFDAMFIDSMIEHHQGAVEMAEMALEQAEHEEIRTLAEEVIAAQTAEIEQMESWRGEWYPDQAPTGGMSMSMGEMMISDDASLPFDQRFIEAMISHHQGAIDMAEMALAQAEHEEIRTLATAIIAAQTLEIEQMQSWLTDWYDIAQ